MRILTERLRVAKNGKEFMSVREKIAKTSYVVMMFIYGFFWWLDTPENVPTFSYYVTFLLLPILTFGLFMRNYYYLYVHNWFFLLFNIITTILFIAIMLEIRVNDYTSPFIYELAHIILANVIGLGVSIAVSFPFKLLQLQLMDVENFYFDSNSLENIDKIINPKKHLEKVKEKQEIMKFDVLNETQLHAELGLAIKEDRFEDAEKIKKILETKFR